MRQLSGLFAGASDDCWGHMDGWAGGWMWLWGLAMMALFLALAVWLVRATTGGTPTPTPKEPTGRAREILAERYARGELTAEEYRERVEHLG